jgi:hypothetical protein
MKRITGGQLSREATATLLSSHAGGPRAATGDKTFVSQTKRADTVVKSQPAASPKDLPIQSDVTAQTAHDSDSESLPVQRLLGYRTSGSSPLRKSRTVIDGNERRSQRPARAGDCV